MKANALQIRPVMTHEIPSKDRNYSGASDPQGAGVRNLYGNEEDSANTLLATLSDGALNIGDGQYAPLPVWSGVSGQNGSAPIVKPVNVSFHAKKTTRNM